MYTYIESICVVEYLSRVCLHETDDVAGHFEVKPLKTEVKLVKRPGESNNFTLDYKKDVHF